MHVDWNVELVDQLESHWQHQLRPRLSGLSDDEYFWQPVPGCWTISRRGQSTAPAPASHISTVKPAGNCGTTLCPVRARNARLSEKTFRWT